MRPGERHAADAACWVSAGIGGSGAAIRAGKGYAYVMLVQNINRELCRRLRAANGRVAEPADASPEAIAEISASNRKVYALFG